MSDFKIIETQEQFDAAVADRIKRAKESAEKKYEGWMSPEDVEKLKADHKTKVDELNGSLTAANEKITNHDKEIADRDSKIKQYETDSVKTRVAHEMGLSYEAVAFLRGDDEDGIRKSAESLKGLVGAGNVAPLASQDGGQGSDVEAGLRNTLNSMKGE